MSLQNHLKPSNAEVPELTVVEDSVSILQGNDGDVVVQHHGVGGFHKPGQEL